MNNITVVGRLTADPTIRYSKDNKPIANFSLADNGRNDKPLFFRCACLSERVASFVQQYLTKGTKVVATGRMEADDYTDRNGQVVHNTVLMINSIEFAESKPQNNQQSFMQGQNTQQPFAPVAQQPFAPVAQQPFMQGQMGTQPMTGMPETAPAAANPVAGIQGNPMTAMPPQMPVGQNDFSNMYNPELPFN